MYTEICVLHIIHLSEQMFYHVYWCTVLKE